MTDGLKIGELARATSCAIETIRYYERERLLPRPVRSRGNFRIYDRNYVVRLIFIRHCRSLDMTLDEIRLLLRFCDQPNDNCGEVNALLDEHIGHVAERVGDLQRLQKQLKELRRACDKPRAAKHCGILKKLAQTPSGVKPEKRRTGHVHGTHTRRATR